MDKLDILRLFAFFRRAPADLRDEIEQVSVKTTLPAGSSYFRSGDPCTGVGLVGQGSIRVFKSADTGREITLYHVEQAETCLLTLHCALTGAVYAAEAQVEVDVEAVVLPVTEFQQWIDQDRELRNFVFDTMARRVVAVTELLEDVLFHRLDRRLAAFLLAQVESRQSKSLNLTHQMIAAELNCARESVSRLLKDFQSRGVVELQRGQIKVIDPLVLQRFEAE